MSGCYTVHIYISESRNFDSSIQEVGRTKLLPIYYVRFIVREMTRITIDIKKDKITHQLPYSLTWRGGQNTPPSLRQV